MADQAKMMGKFRASTDTHNSNIANKVNKRNRQPLSCLPCRQRKLKCDRSHPCETCLKRNDETSCIYSKVSNTSKSDVASRSKAQERLRQLEQLVMQMVDSNGTPTTDASAKPIATPPTSLADEDIPGDGRLELNGKYVGSTHWSAILENINELKTAMADEGPETPDFDESEGTDSPDQELLFGSRRGLSLQSILAQHLPLRVQVDRLLSTYFNAKYSVIPYIHTYRFQRQYEQVWKDPLNIDPLWFSILFSICCIASQLTAATTSIASTRDDAKTQIRSFLVASAQCLVLGGYTRPKKYVVEALGLHTQCVYNGSLDPSREAGFLFPLLIRLAYQMGYHRDPENFPKISTFEGEIRRRVWTMCRQFDLMLSFQLGLPNSIPLDSWDTKQPRNLLDADFDEDTKVLPPSRPENEPTQILYFIVKSRLMTNFGRICNHALSFKNSSQAEIMALDADVRQTFATIPETLHCRPMSQSFADPPYLLMVRLNCKFLYEKSLLVLHRKYMTQGFDVSTRACIDSAMAICTCFADMHKEFQPGGQLYHDRWMLSSFTINDFLLAAMILCLALSQWRKRNPGKDVGKDPTAAEQLAMLRTAFEICQERAPTSTESRKVAEGLKAMLAKFPSTSPTETTTTPSLTGKSNSYTTSKFSPQTDVVNLTPLSLSEGSSGQQTGADTYANGSDLGPFENFLDGAENIDWQFLDQYLVNPERYDDDGGGVNTTTSNAVNGLGDWESTPYRFLGQQNNGVTSYPDYSHTIGVNVHGEGAGGDGSGAPQSAMVGGVDGKSENGFMTDNIPKY